MSYFKNKVAIVTGSGMGIGKAIALELCKQGAKVVLNGRNAERLEKAHAEFKQKGFDVIAVSCDITKIADCDMLINKAIETFGQLDILITNASVSMRERFDRLQPEIFADIIHSNVNGSAFPAWKALPHIKKTKGSIVFISSAAGLHGMPTGSAYSAGKMALTALAQSMRIELSGTGVHVGIVHVGFTQNEDEKRVLNAKGELIPVATRPAYLQQTREQVAMAVLRLIRKRQSKVILTVMGKLNAFMVRFFPGLVSRIIIYSQKRMKDMYE
jgi:NAD(P)-dependent dehydrogenase (short-subunit alcohol dehydrogenase family)